MPREMLMEIEKMRSKLRIAKAIIPIYAQIGKDRHILFPIAACFRYRGQWFQSLIQPPQSLCFSIPAVIDKGIFPIRLLILQTVKIHLPVAVLMPGSTGFPAIHQPEQRQDRPKRWRIYMADAGLRILPFRYYTGNNLPVLNWFSFHHSFGRSPRMALGAPALISMFHKDLTSW